MLCCVCLQECPQALICEDLGIKLNAVEIINKHLSFKPILKDALTLKICSECWHKIYEFHKFYVIVEEVHHKFIGKEIYIKDEDNPPISNIKQEDKEDIFLTHSMQIEIEIDANRISYSTDVSSNLKNPLDDACRSEKCDIAGYSDDDESPKITNQDFKSDTELKKYFKVNSYKLKKGIKKIYPSAKRVINIDTSKKRKISNRLDPILTDEIIKKHIPMTCNLCIYVGKTFSDIIEHFKEHHENAKPYIMCCDKKFTRSYCIAQHAYTHENPNSFSCTECNKSFTTSYGLRIHNISYHASEEERTHACEICPRKFGRRNLLELHKQTHIPKEQWTIICTKCTTRTAKFATQYLLNIHTSMYHRREVNICQVCAKEIKDKKSFEKHVRSHFEGSGPRLKCPMENCESWLKDEDNLKTHVQRYHLDDKTYKCPDCNKVCPNRRSLSSHKHYFHSKEIFRCKQCDKTFKKALTLKEHMTQHTGETLYNCPFCTRTFNSNANMHSHKKKQHPVEWEKLRRKKIGPLSN